MTRAAIYARYSSNNQRDASIEDQVEVCRRYIAQQRGHQQTREERIYDSNLRQICGRLVRAGLVF